MSETPVNERNRYEMSSYAYGSVTGHVLDSMARRLVGTRRALVLYNAPMSNYAPDGIRHYTVVRPAPHGGYNVITEVTVYDRTLWV